MRVGSVIGGGLRVADIPRKLSSAVKRERNVLHFQANKMLEMRCGKYGEKRGAICSQHWNKRFRIRF